MRNDLLFKARIWGCPVITTRPKTAGAWSPLRCQEMMLQRATHKKSYFRHLEKHKTGRLSCIYFILLAVTPAALGPPRTELHAGLPECPSGQNAVALFLMSLWQRQSQGPRDPPTLKHTNGALPAAARLQALWRASRSNGENPLPRTRLMNTAFLRRTAHWLISLDTVGTTHLPFASGSAGCIPHLPAKSSYVPVVLLTDSKHATLAG